MLIQNTTVIIFHFLFLFVLYLVAVGTMSPKGHSSELMTKRKLSLKQTISLFLFIVAKIWTHWYMVKPHIRSVAATGLLYFFYKYTSENEEDLKTTVSA